MRLVGRWPRVQHPHTSHCPLLCVCIAIYLCFSHSWADKIQGKTIPVDGPFWAYTLHEPLGVVGQISELGFKGLKSGLRALLVLSGLCILVR